MKASTLETLLKSYSWFEHPEGPKFVEFPGNERRSLGHWLYIAPVFSAFHRVLNNDEVWAIHQGTVHLHLIDNEGGYHLWKLGTTLEAGEAPLLSVPKGWLQAAGAAPGTEYAFGTNVCAPRFRYDEFELPKRASLLEMYPQHRDVIEKYTRQ